MFSDKELNQILHTVGYESTAGLLLLRRRIIEQDEYLATLRRDLKSKAGAAAIPVHYVLFGVGSASIVLLVSFSRGMARSRQSPCYLDPK
jgi:hypothetical protein